MNFNTPLKQPPLDQVVNSSGPFSLAWQTWLMQLYAGTMFSGSDASSGNVITATGNTTLTVAQSGSWVISTNAGAVTYTMPSATKGAFYFFIGNAYANILSGGTFMVAGGTTSSSFTMTASVGQMLVVMCDGTNWNVLDNVSTYKSPTLVTHTSPSGTSDTISGIPTWANKITVILNGIGTSGTSAKLIQIGSGGVTNSGYVSQGIQLNGASNGFTAYTTGFGISSVVATDRLTGTMHLTKEDASTNLWVCSGEFEETVNVHGELTNGKVALSGPLDRVILTAVNGTDTIAAGNWAIRYEA